MYSLTLPEEYFAKIARDEFRFVYDGYLQVEELDALDGNSVTKTHAWEPDGNRLLSTTISGTTYYAITDANKNITEYVDSTGSVQAHFEYSPFGKINSVSGSNPDAFDFRFSSEYYDVETGLVYYNFRYYSPELGRWMSRDPIEEESGMNLYAMVGNDAMNYIDLLGLADASFYKEGADASREAYLKTVSDVPKTEPNTINVIVTAPEYGGRICCKERIYKRTPPEKTSIWIMTKVEIVQGRKVKYYTSIPKDPKIAEIIKTPIKTPAIIPALLKTCEEVFGSGWKSIAIYHSHPGKPNFSEEDITLPSRSIIFMGHKEIVKVAEPKEVPYDETIDGRRVRGKTTQVEISNVNSSTSEKYNTKILTKEIKTGKFKDAKGNYTDVY